MESFLIAKCLFTAPGTQINSSSRILCRGKSKAWCGEINLVVGTTGGVVLVDSQRDLLPLERDPPHARASLSTHFPPMSPRQGKAGVGVLMEKLNNAGNTKPSGKKQRV